MASSNPPSLTLVLPVFNGAGFFGRSLQDAAAWLASLERETELLVVDDRSTDGTADIIAEFVETRRGSPSPRITVLTNAKNSGKGFAVRRGFVAARGDWIVFTDADLTYPLDNVRSLLAELAAGADLVYGSRMHRDSRYVVAPSFFGPLFRRHIAGRLFNSVVRAAVVPGVLDSQAGLKGFRRDSARRLASVVRLNRFSFDVEILFAARRLGMTARPCPVRFIYRKEPSTVHFMRDSLAMLRDIVRVRWRGFRGGYDRANGPDSAAELFAGWQPSSEGEPKPRRSSGSGG